MCCAIPGFEDERDSNLTQGKASLRLSTVEEQHVRLVLETRSAGAVAESLILFLHKACGAAWEHPDWMTEVAT